MELKYTVADVKAISELFGMIKYCVLLCQPNEWREYGRDNREEKAVGQQDGKQKSKSEMMHHDELGDRERAAYTGASDSAHG